MSILSKEPVIRLKHLIPGIFVLGLSCAASAQSANPQQTDVHVMVIGTYHMSNPGQDLHNMQADDVLTPARQSEIASVTENLARFTPTVIAVEWPADETALRWEEYLAGGLKASRNEVVQIGFRLAALAGAKPLGVDAPGDFPFGPLASLAEEIGRQEVIAQGMQLAEIQTSRTELALREGGVATALRVLNEPAYYAQGHRAYMSTLRIGQGDRQPGVDLMKAWYGRNARICANVIQSAQPADRIVVLFGAGHTSMLRDCFATTPGFQLVDPLLYLPTNSTTETGALSPPT